MHVFYRIWDALSFLTCFPARKDQTGADCRESILFFVPAGLILGLVLFLLSWPVALFCPGRGEPLPAPFLFAWLWLFFEIVLTRALHWDGVADVCDALGSGKAGDAFFEVLHDSRIGTFGVLGLLLVFTGQLLCVAALYSEERWFFLVLAPAWARAVPLQLAARLPFHPTSRLGLFFATALDHARHATLLHTLLLVFLPLFLGFFFSPPLFLLVPLEFGLIAGLVRVARREGGLSGDFLGAGIELSQLLFLFVAFL